MRIIGKVIAIFYVVLLILFIAGIYEPASATTALLLFNSAMLFLIIGLEAK